MQSQALRRKDDRIILHFDYDCFYASVIEAENPSLKSLPLAVQQKQIVVTCNYEARRRGLYKLQLITDAKRVCPDVVIVLGEDLTRFRDASKQLYSFLRSFSWSDKVERLGFDEVWMDVTDVVNYNIDLLNSQNLQNSFFHLSKLDPTVGFEFDASKIAGHGFPRETSLELSWRSGRDQSLLLRLILGSHIALHLRHQLEERQGYTSTVGISTSKLLSKLVGNQNKPKAQTTLLPPYETSAVTSDCIDRSSVLALLDGLDVGLIPGIGFKLARRLRELVLGHPAEVEQGLVYGAPKEKVTTERLRALPGLSPKTLEKELTAPGAPHDVGLKVYLLVNGIDESEVTDARNVPKQISLEDSYIRLDTMEQAVAQLRSLSERLIQRMRLDLTESEPDSESPHHHHHQLTWIARPTTARLSTRPRMPMREDGTRARTFNRISRSSALPAFVFTLDAQPAELADRLVKDVWLPLFKKLHPESHGWNLSLINIAVTGMEEQHTLGADISSMFRKQLHAPVLSNEEQLVTESHGQHGQFLDQSDGTWAEDEDQTDGVDGLNDGFPCALCGFRVPLFAQAAHQRFHDLGST